MTTCKRWDIVLVPFPFTNLSRHKKRPAIIVSPNNYNRGNDVVILFVTSQVKASGRQGDYKLKKWEEAGLPKPSMTRMKFATIDKNIVIKAIARVQEIDRNEIEKRIIDFFSDVSQK